MIEKSGPVVERRRLVIYYTIFMTAKILKDVLERVETWPEAAQVELAELAREIEAGFAGGPYPASADELAGIDLGTEAAGEGRFATASDVEAVFAKHRGA